jgi:serine/threonine protein kinase
MGITISNCCSKPGFGRFNVFHSQENKSIEIPLKAPSSIDTANIVIGAQKKKLTLSSFEILKSIGNGAFAKVFLVRLKGGNKLYALKLIPKKTIRNDYALNSILKEREILLKSNHPFILKLRYSFQDPAYFCYVMDYMKGGPISKYIEAEGKNGLPQPIVQWYAAQVLLALQCLHETMNVVYRDLKPDNILVDEHGNIKLADFGISQGELNSRCRAVQHILWDSPLPCPRNPQQPALPENGGLLELRLLRVRIVDWGKPICLCSQPQRALRQDQSH